ncbi:uncharacterized protein LOC121735940 isoform X1 [Aricia agestis]|uniref:uncharacterized protein LOC121735940 isoform X1 n=1 Tax=Aricia agestis TaxID=91739 RepID=UPI001C20273F|nr:uncharacterized protein LOC121735940 isoform X1 [Aricia agestis]
MCAVWYLSVLVLAAEVNSAVLDINKNVELTRCYQCVSSNRTRCEGVGPSVLCPAGRVCATTAAPPGYESSLTCAAAAPSCWLSGLRLTCTCAGHLCNRPFAPHLTEELKNLPENTTLEAFFNSTLLANESTKLYDTITVQVSNFSMPRAEALKQVTLSPDDEDDGEGSGAFEDKVPSAPAAPSSFLPSEHNDATVLGLKSLLLLLHVALVLKYS